MRISYWSSDVCSSDLCADRRHTIDRQADMHRPVAAPTVAFGLGIFARAVDRIDDPHTRFAQPRRIVLFLCGEQAIVGAKLTQRIDQKAVGFLVAGLAQRLSFELAAGAHFEQDTPRLLRQMCRQSRVVHYRTSISAPGAATSSDGCLPSPQLLSDQARSCR